MSESTIDQTSERTSNAFIETTALPAILVAYAPAGASTVDSCLISDSFVLGRSSACDLQIRDDKVSKKHMRITQSQEGYLIEDLGSTNNTFVYGFPVTQKQVLPSPAVIRVGRAVLVFHADAKAFLNTPPTEDFGMAGCFHTGPLLQNLLEASISARHVLLAGPSGSGKELAANALVHLMKSDDSPPKFVAHNAARFTSEEEAASTLFGVSAKVFSNVDPRPGLIEEANGGVLFLDEIHNLPERVQRSLLRVIEDGQSARIGETQLRPANVHFIFASNASAPSYSLAHDLLARLRVVRLPPLTERVADVPAIFNAVLGAELNDRKVLKEKVFSLLSGDHYEALCLDGFSKENVRGLVDLADRITTRIASGIDPTEAITTIFTEQFGHGQVARRYAKENEPSSNASRYEKNKEIIIAAYKQNRGNLSSTERLLRSRGIRCSRRWLAIWVKRWGVR